MNAANALARQQEAHRPQRHTSILTEQGKKMLDLLEGFDGWPLHHALVPFVA